MDLLNMDPLLKGRIASAALILGGAIGAIVMISSLAVNTPILIVCFYRSMSTAPLDVQESMAIGHGMWYTVTSSYPSPSFLPSFLPSTHTQDTESRMGDLAGASTGNVARLTELFSAGVPSSSPSSPLFIL
jgi:hypothetical protein